jgi:hypothetical protein
MKSWSCVRALRTLSTMALTEQKSALRKRIAEELKKLDVEEIEKQCRRPCACLLLVLMMTSGHRREDRASNEGLSRSKDCCHILINAWQRSFDA